jgi:hypothetical protein
VGRPARAGDQARAGESGADLQAALEGRRRVERLVQQQRALHLAPVDGDRSPRWCGPEEARRVEPRVVPRRERCLRVDALAVGPPPGVALRPVGVGALHAEVDGEVVVVPDPDRRVVERLERLPVAVVHPAGERVGDVLPPEDVVGRPEEDVGPFIGPDQAARGMSVEVGQHRVVEVLDGLPCGAEVEDVAVLGDPLEVDADVAVEGAVLIELRRVPHPARVYVAVQHHPSHPLREQGAVDLTEIGAVREAVVVDLLLAQGLPDAVHVPDGVQRGEVGEQRRVVLAGARRRVALRAAEPDLLELWRVGHVVRAVVAEVVRDAAQCVLAQADPSRVEPDPVVALSCAIGDERAEHRIDETGATRTSGVDQHDALELGVWDRVPDPGDGEVDLITVRTVVVHRHLHHAALRVEAHKCRVGAPSPTHAPGLGRCVFRCWGLHLGAGVGCRGDPHGHQPHDRDQTDHPAHKRPPPQVDPWCESPVGSEQTRPRPRCQAVAAPERSLQNGLRLQTGRHPVAPDVTDHPGYEPARCHMAGRGCA